MYSLIKIYIISESLIQDIYLIIIKALYSVKKLDISVLPLSFYVTRSVSEIDGSFSCMLIAISLMQFFRNRSKSRRRC